MLFSWIFCISHLKAAHRDALQLSVARIGKKYGIKRLHCIVLVHPRDAYQHSPPSVERSLVEEPNADRKA